MSEWTYDLSVLVVTFNEAAHITRLKQAVDNLQRPTGFRIEMVVVDGGSRDGTVAAAREAGIEKVIELPGANIPCCRNRAAREAQGQCWAYFDGDCAPAPDWLSHALRLGEALGPAILGWPAQPPAPLNCWQAAWHFHWLNKNRAWDDVAGQRVVQTEGFRLVTTRNLFMHRDVFDAIHGFNEALATGEDTDFTFRAYMHGFPVLGVPAMQVVHYGEPRTLGAFFRQQIWHANRKSYAHIRALSGGTVGGHAPRFTWAFTAACVAALAGVLAALLSRQWWVAAVLSLPLGLVLAAPATWISLRGRSLRHWPHLFILYALYGTARMWDALGLATQKTSWKFEQAN